MPNNISVAKDKFKVFIETVVNNELSEIEKDQFAIEGGEVVDEIFEANKPLPVNARKHDLAFDYGLSPQSLEVAKVSVEFIGLIIACFKIYVDFVSIKNDKEKLELSRKEFAEKLTKEKLPGELSERISEKYVDAFKQFLDSL